MDRIRDAFRDSLLMRSGLVTVLVLTGVLGSVIGLWILHMHGGIHKVIAVKYQQDRVVGGRPGGMDLVRLNRLPMAATMTPEFLSAVVTPGVGMQLLQTTINVPSQGEVPLLVSSNYETRTDTSSDITGSPIVVSSAGKNGAHWDEPVNLLFQRQADRVTTNAMPDGGGTDALFSGVPKTGRTNDNGIQTNITFNLSGHALELSVIARNVIEEPRSVALSWQPKFQIPGGVGSMMLVPPMVEGSSPGVTANAIAIGSRNLNTTYTKLKHSYLGGGPEAQLRDDADGYILHLTAVSASVRSLHVESSQGGNWVTLSFSTASGEGGDDTRTVLQPGESLQMRLRLEVTGISSYYNR